jgi:pSer/pThr/pTyr-binding forkhead associated (FHA) protein
VITCSRCGKENQKHYKFCLGCGAKLEAPAAPAAEPARVPSAAAPAVLDATAPVPVLRNAGGGLSPVPSGPGVYGLGGASSGSASPASASVAPAPSFGAGMGASAGMSSGGGNSGAMSARGASLPSGLSGSGGLGSGPVPGPVPGQSMDGLAQSGTVNDRDIIPCPNCGKPVVATYAFCGSCGQRMKGSGAAAGGAPQASARTMHLGSSSPSPRAAPRGHLTLIRPDGTEGGVHPLQDGENLIGRGQGSLFDADPYLSPRHAEFAFTDDGLMVRDLRSLNGVFIKILQEEKLESGDVFRIGQELLRFDVIAPPAPLEDGTETIGTPNPGFWGRISVIVGRDVDGPAFPLFDETVVLGRERGDILFPEDGYVSGTHAQLTLRDGQVYLSDLGSSNGTFFRIRGNRTVASGNLLLMGQQLFRASYR